MLQISISGFSFAVDERTNGLRRCDSNFSCLDCLFGEGSCINGRKEWLEQEYQEPITLTDDEKVILKNLPKRYEWIARDKNGRLYLYPEKPLKIEDWWQSEGSKLNFSMFNDLFQFIKWEDEDSYNIDELLKQNGVKRDEE